MSNHNKAALPAESGKGSARKKTMTYGLALIVVSGILLLMVGVSLSVGRYHISFSECWQIVFKALFSGAEDMDPLSVATVMKLRFPRTVAAVIVGGSLALSGAAYQSIFKNPMVSPDLLGVSSGACIGAAIAILMDGNSALIQIMAFVTGLAAVGLTTSIPRLIRSDSTTVLVLSGVVIGALMSSIINIIKFVADPDDKLAEITYWMMGSFATVTFKDMLPMLPTIFIPVAVLLFMRFRLNVLSLGDNEARSLGVNLRKTRGIFILCSTLITASCVCMCGNVGWVGLIIPHTARMMVGADNKRMLPIALLSGSIFMIVIDILCRTLSAAELKLGILTGVIGAPFFIFILIKQHRSLQ